MDWNIFWSAFGAIGTTIGSLITAGAVVIAVKQYKQPLKKVIKVEFTSAVSLNEISGRSLCFYCVSIKNKGIRTVQINSINIKGNKKKLWINNAQFNSNAKVNLPIKIEPEENIDFLFEIENLKNALRTAVSDRVLRKNQRLIIFATDSLGDNYYCKTKTLIRQIVK